MISYSNSNIVQCLRQYEMFANSLNLVKSREEKSMIIKQLSKLELKIIELTNEIYVDEYYALANKETSLLDEEKNRLNMLIELINQRLSYVEKRCNDHFQLTGESIDVEDVLGASTLDILEDKVRIIDKYSKNIKLKEELEDDITSINSKIALASEKIEINKSLNLELENKLSSLLTDAFEKLGFYELFENKDDIEYAYYEIEKLLTLAELNLESAKNSSSNVLDDCQQMYDDIRKNYVEYKEKINILKLMEIFNRNTSNYQELLDKRREINELFKYIKNEKFVDIVMETITKQYNAIIMEQQDINTFNDLTLEKSRKEEALVEIRDENNSNKFQSVLSVLIENEKKKQQKILEERKKIEEEEKRKQQEIDKKKQEEVLRRQKIIEDARKKEIERRTKELLEQQQKSVLQSKKNDEFSFETIKSISNNDEDKADDKIDDDKIIVNNVPDLEEKEEFNDKLMFKNKIDIEKELFDEFNDKKDTSNNEDSYKKILPLSLESENGNENNNFFGEDLEKTSDKLPNVSIDEYMKNFKENSDNKMDSLFQEDDIFPNIPL